MHFLTERSLTSALNRPLPGIKLTVVLRLTDVPSSFFTRSFAWLFPCFFTRFFVWLFARFLARSLAGLCARSLFMLFFCLLLFYLFLDQILYLLLYLILVLVLYGLAVFQVCDRVVREFCTKSLDPSRSYGRNRDIHMSHIRN